MKKLLCVLAVALAVALSGNLAFSQDAGEAAPAEVQALAQEGTPAAPPANVTPAAVEPSEKELAIYGEVQNVDPAANSLTVQYYDYDNDEEKTIDVMADKDTKIENAAALANIAKGDWVDVTYVVQNARNVAKSIMVEKEEPEEGQGPAAGADTATEMKPAGMPDEE